MFEIFSTLILKALSKVFDTTIDSVAKDFSSKRSMAAASIELFDSLYKLENTSIAAYTVFKEIADGKRTTTKVMVTDKMEDLFRSFQTFVKNLRAVESRFEIYDHELLVSARDLTIMGKRSMFEHIDMLLDAVPSQVRRENKLTSSITYLAEVPETNLFEAAHTIQGKSGREIAALKKSILSKFKKKAINLELPSEAKIALQSAEKNIKSIQETRERLAEFIRKNFPLKDILC